LIPNIFLHSPCGAWDTYHSMQCVFLSRL
jgi:hypothetical protein